MIITIIVFRVGMMNKTEHGKVLGKRLFVRLGNRAFDYPEE